MVVFWDQGPESRVDQNRMFARQKYIAPTSSCAGRFVFSRNLRVSTGHRGFIGFSEPWSLRSCTLASVSRLMPRTETDVSFKHEAVLGCNCTFAEGFFQNSP